MKKMNRCEFCQAVSPPYVCPRCKVQYCSLSCYKCDAHVGCSEQFYQECVESQLKEQRMDETGKESMQHALIREQKTRLEDDSESLEDRLALVDLDDPDEILKALTDEQRRTFDRLVESDEMAKYIAVWSPWWTGVLIQEVKPNLADKSGGEKNILVGYKRQNKMSRPKIGGKKVQQLSGYNGKGNNVTENDDEFSRDKRAVHKDSLFSKDIPKSEMKSVEYEDVNRRVSPCEEAKSDCKQTDVVQEDKKTRITDPRHRSKRIVAAKPEGEGMNFENKKSTVCVEHDGLSQNSHHSITEGRPSHRNCALAKMESTHVDCEASVVASEAKSINKVNPTSQNILLDDLIGSLRKVSSWTIREETLASNVVNMVAAFVFVARFYNGDFSSNEREVADILQSICGVLKGQNFKTVDVALCDILLHDIVVNNTRPNLLIKDVSLVSGNVEYILRALNELRTLFKIARCSLRKITCSETTELSQCSSHNVNCSTSDGKRLKLLVLKLDFFIDWVTKETTNLQKWILPQIELEIRKRSSSSDGSVR